MLHEAIREGEEAQAEHSEIAPARAEDAAAGIFATPITAACAW
jgi:hypothetical protein